MLARAGKPSYPNISTSSVVFDERMLKLSSVFCTKLTPAATSTPEKRQGKTSKSECKCGYPKLNLTQWFMKSCYWPPETCLASWTSVNALPRCGIACARPGEALQVGAAKIPGGMGRLLSKQETKRDINKKGAPNSKQSETRGEPGIKIVEWLDRACTCPHADTCPHQAPSQSSTPSCCGKSFWSPSQ